MKLRILGDSLRLRLSRGEVDELGAKGRVDDAIRFGAARLSYALLADAGVEAPRASFDAATIVVRVPAGSVRAWVDGDEVTLCRTEGAPNILVEKDFKCAVPRTGEDDYDGFDNPSSSC